MNNNNCMGPGNMITPVAQKSVGMNTPVFADSLRKFLQPAWSSFLCHWKHPGELV